ncbi:MAG: hypothetical protein ACYTEO_19615 [Planctomycetota bacterium]
MTKAKYTHPVTPLVAPASRYEHGRDYLTAYGYSWRRLVFSLKKSIECVNEMVEVRRAYNFGPLPAKSISEQISNDICDAYSRLTPGCEFDNGNNNLPDIFHTSRVEADIRLRTQFVQGGNTTVFHNPLEIKTTIGDSIRGGRIDEKEASSHDAPHVFWFLNMGADSFIHGFAGVVVPDVLRTFFKRSPSGRYYAPTWDKRCVVSGLARGAMLPFAGEFRVNERYADWLNENRRQSLKILTTGETQKS